MAKIDALVISTFHKDVFRTIDTQRLAVDKATNTMTAKLGALIASKYGNVLPSYAQFRADHDALSELAKEKGLVDNQWVRKPYNAAMNAIFGKLPESLSGSALAKRALREKEAVAALAKLNAQRVAKGDAPLDKMPKKVAAPAKPGKDGMPKGTVPERTTSPAETIEQYIARVGLWQVMDACARMLNADKSTFDVANVLQPIVKKHLKAA